VDAASHAGALREDGRTLAVLGSGVNVVYPRENRRLYREILDSGAVISEFPLDTPPLRGNFPRRNRIISGLSLGVLVVEATDRSGTLITVDWALEQGREVFAVPGNVDSPLSRGTHRLIRDGAKLVEEVSDILEELKEVEDMKPRQKLSPSSRTPRPCLGPRESRVLSLLSSSPVHIDDLVSRSGYPVSVVSALLTLLEMKSLAIQLPGSFFVTTEQSNRSGSPEGAVKGRRRSRRRSQG
jgi:DNA processing protein